MTEKLASPPKSDLATRAVAGVAMIAVATAAIYFGGWPFRILVAAGAAIMLLEWSDMHRVARLWGLIGAALVALGLLAAPDTLFPAPVMADLREPALRGFGLAVALALALGLASRRAILAGGFLYVAIPSLALLLLNAISYQIVFWVMLVTWSTDIFAYFAGRSIGGPKLAPKISPNKTWAGLIGGMLGAAIVGWIAARGFDLRGAFLYLGGAMGLLAQMGDLYESWLKRRAGVKDSGTILPGHGGVLDRLDGLLPVILVTFILLMLAP